MNSLNEWLSLSNELKASVFREVAREKRIPPAAIEKDWWVVHALSAIYATEIGPHTVFKGGTSLSKAWNLIERFSEDIDLALDRKFLGFEKEMTISQVKKLRKKSYEYISSSLFPELKAQFEKMGLNVIMEIEPVKDTDKDPLILQIMYPSVVEESGYILPRVLIELGSRSLKEPFSLKPLRSYVGEVYSGRKFADTQFSIPCVNPERTFLEKIFLLHEEFQKPIGKIRADRMSRHLYDLGKLMDSPFAEIAFANNLQLYDTIVAHRQIMTPLRGIDYKNHKPDHINPIPPLELLPEWKKDYQVMQESMIFGDSLPFDTLIQQLTKLKLKINSLAKK
jgi:predicted nucleotidyltransferase component of viral defense system